MNNKIIATIQKIRYVPGYSYHEIYYTLDGSDKVRKHILHSCMPELNKAFWRADEIHHWLKSVSYALKSIGDGIRSKTRYDRNQSRHELKAEILYCGNGRIFVDRCKENP